MRTLVLVAWLMVPVGLAAYHYGPGQEQMRLDVVAGLLRQADRHAAKEEWAEAAQSYDEALRLLPASLRRTSKVPCAWRAWIWASCKACRCRVSDRVAAAENAAVAAIARAKVNRNKTVPRTPAAPVPVRRRTTADIKRRMHQSL